MRPGGQMVARVRLSDSDGNPICTRLRPRDITRSAR